MGREGLRGRPQHGATIGLLAGLLERNVDASRSKMLMERLTHGDVHGATAGFFYHHAVLAEWEQAAAWFAKAVDQHDMRVPWILPRMFGDDLTSSPYWPALAKKMNLPM